MNLILVRHAHADWTPDDTRSLSRKGVADAERVADLLAPFGVRAMYSSPSTRAIQTVQPLASRLGLDIGIEADLRERELCAGRVDDFEGAVAATWNDFSLSHPGGESNADAQARVTRCIERIVKSTAASPIVLASHGNAIALFLQTLDPTVGFDFWRVMSMPDVFLLDLRSNTHRRLWSLP